MRGYARRCSATAVALVLLCAACSNDSVTTAPTTTAPVAAAPSSTAHEGHSDTTTTLHSDDAETHDHDHTHSTDTTPTEEPSPTVTASILEAPSPTISIEVVNGEPVGGHQRVAVELNSEVAISVTSDVAEEVHVHGYDILHSVSPGQPLLFSFTAEIPGVFEVELEGSHRLLVQLTVS